MKKPYDKPMTAEEIARVPDSEIDFSDIPERDDKFWKKARLVNVAERTETVTLRVKRSVLEAYKAQGAAQSGGYLASMNAVLESHAPMVTARHFLA